MSALMNSLLRATNGRISYADGSSVPDRVWNGLPLEANGALAVDINGVTDHYHMGLPFTAEGRLILQSADIEYFNTGAAGFSANARLAFQGINPSVFVHGVGYDQTTGRLSMGIGAPVIPDSIPPTPGPAEGDFPSDLNWTPANLFTNGEEGGYYDASNLATLFQDDDGLVPVTAPAQIVRRVTDLSGNGKDLISSSLATQAWETDGVSAWIGSTGGGGNLSTNTNKEDFGFPWTLAVASRWESSTSNNPINITSDTGFVRLGRQFTSERPNVSFQNNAPNNVAGDTVLNDGTSYSQILTVTPTEARLWVNGSPDSAFNPYSGVFDEGNTGVYTLINAGVPIRVYASLWIDRELTSAERELLDQWLQSKILAGPTNEVNPDTNFDYPEFWSTTGTAVVANERVTVAGQNNGLAVWRDNFVTTTDTYEYTWTQQNMVSGGFFPDGSAGTIETANGTFTKVTTLPASNGRMGLQCGLGPTTGEVTFLSVKLLFVNPYWDFETDLEGWTPNVNCSLAVEAGRCRMQVFQPTTGLMSQAGILPAGWSGTVRVRWDQDVTTGTRGRVRFRNFNDSGDNGYNMYHFGTGSFVTPEIQITNGFSLQMMAEFSNTPDIYWDNIVVEILAQDGGAP